MNNDKPLPQLTLDELHELAEAYAQKYEPRFRNCAIQAARTHMTFDEL